MVVLPHNIPTVQYFVGYYIRMYSTVYSTNTNVTQSLISEVFENVVLVSGGIEDKLRNKDTISILYRQNSFCCRDLLSP